MHRHGTRGFMTMLAWALVACTVTTIPAAAQAEPAHAQATIADLAWMAGEWSVTMDDQTIQEHWMQPSSNALLGMGRTLAGDRMVAFEYLRVETRNDGLYYVAQPNGRPPTSFRLTSWDGTTAVFANPEHDFPKRVRYTKTGPDAMTAVVDGGEGTDALTFAYSRTRR